MSDITPFNFAISRKERNILNGHNSFVIWFTGLSGAGKSTLSNFVEELLYGQGIHTFSLDGDNIRAGLNKNLSFTAEDRKENLRVIAEITKLFVESGTVVLASFISPEDSGRSMVKEIIGVKDYIEVYVKASLENCENRDVKGLYKKAREGSITNFTGIHSNYEEPENPHFVIDSDVENLEEAAKNIVRNLKSKLELEEKDE